MDYTLKLHQARNFTFLSGNFNKTFLASAILLAAHSAYADDCNNLAPQAGVSCVQNGNQLNIDIHADIDNPTPYPAYSFNAQNGMQSDKVVISLDAGKTLTADQNGIQAQGNPLALDEIEVSTSGNIYTGKATDSDAADPLGPITGPSGGIIFDKTNVRDTQHAGVYLSGTSGGVLALGSVLQQSGSQIVNNSASKDTAAIYSQALESRITSSGVIRSQVGDAIRVESTPPEYTWSSGGYIIVDPQGVFDVHLKADSVVEGGSEGAGIKTTGGTQSTVQIDQGATLGALSDVAIDVAGFDGFYLRDPILFNSPVDSTHYSGAETHIVNAGTMTGVVRLSSGQDTVINDATGVWNVRQWSDSDRDGIRDTVAPVATSDFGGGTTELVNRGVISLTARPDGTANHALFDNLATFRNQGSLQLTNNVAGDRFTLNGDYVGDGGVIALDTVLGDDNSLTDQLIINGSTSGQSVLSINNLGGTGAQTRDGIKVIEVNGDSSGVFTQSGRIVGGAYEYYLHKNSLSVQDGNWYLRSELPSVTPDPQDPEPVQRPEIGSYMVNHMAANTLFQTRLHDRLGEAQYTDALTGEQTTSLWLRQVGGHNRSQDGSGQFKNQGNRYVSQIGGDIAQWSSDQRDRWHLGIMAGYARQSNNTESRYSHYQSKGSVKGYSAGLYGTWYANDEKKTGSYVDSWVLYNWFDNEVKGDQLATEKYKSRGITASVEAGYTFELGSRETDAVGYYIQPKAQLIWMGVRSSDHTERQSSGGSRVSFEGDGNLQSRLGVRAYLQGHSTVDKGKNREFQPFIEANWIHNTRDFGASINGQGNEIAGTRNIGEAKIGVEGQLSRQLDMWGNVTQQIGNSGYSDTQAMIGIKYRF